MKKLFQAIKKMFREYDNACKSNPHLFYYPAHTAAMIH